VHTDYLNGAPVVSTHWRSQHIQVTPDLTGLVIHSNIYILSCPSLAPYTFTPPFVPTSTRANRLSSCSLLRETKVLITMPLQLSQVVVDKTPSSGKCHEHDIYSNGSVKIAAIDRAYPQPKQMHGSKAIPVARILQDLHLQK
jgi:hypothetical protein